MIDLILKAMRERPYSFKSIGGTYNSYEIIDTKTATVFKYRYDDEDMPDLLYPKIKMSKNEKKQISIAIKSILNKLDTRCEQVERNKLILAYS